MSTSKKPAPKKADKTAAPARPAAPSAPHRHHKPGLGRGLGALISHPATVPHPTAAAPLAMPAASPAHAPDTVMPAGPQSQKWVLEIPAGEIMRSPWQPRQTFDEEALRELAESIRANGVIQPLICRKNGDNRFELIAGERRLRAAIEAGIAKVPIILVDAEDRRAAEMAIIENIQRQDLNVIEEAEGYRTLAETFTLTQQEVADRVGKARASVANALRLLELPDEVKQLVGSGLLSTGYFLPTILTTLGLIFYDAWQLSAVTEEEGRAKFFTKIFRTYSSVLFCCAAGIIWLCRPVMHVMKSNYYYAWHFVPFLVLASTCSCFNQFMHSVYVVNKKSTRSMITMMAGAVINCIMNYFFIEWWGPVGAT